MKQQRQRWVKLTITNGTSVSNGVDLEGDEVIALLTDPSGWTAAGGSFEAAQDPRSGSGENKGAYGTGTYYAVGLDGTGAQLSIATAQMATANLLLVRDTILAKLKGLQHIRLRSGTTAAPVNQSGADRVMYLLLQSQP